MYKQIFALFCIVAVASAGIVAPVIGLGGVSYTQRLNGYGPILGVGHVGIGHVGHLGYGVGHLGHGVGHLGHHGVGLGYGVGHVGVIG